MKDIALALGGGGVRGIAHVGVIRALIAEGYTIKAISGTSAGGIVGAAFASGMSTDEIIKITSKLNDMKIFSPSFSSEPSMLGLSGFEKEMLDAIGDIQFNQLKIPFGCTAVEINSAQEFVFTNGRVLDAVMATIAVPGVFPPKQIGDYTFVDGAILDPVPVALARWLAPNFPIVAVCLTPIPENWAHMPPIINPPLIPFTQPIINQFSRLRIAKAFTIFTRSMETTARMLAELRMKLDKPDIILRPSVGEIALLDNVSTEELIFRGEQIVRDSKKELQQIFGMTKQVVRLFNQPVLPGKEINTGTIPLQEKIK
jgi:NTE family protein